MSKILFILRGKLPFIIAVLLAFLGVISPMTTLWKTQASGTISGRVFQDFNGNGSYDISGGTAAAPEAVDTGIANVTVTAYDASGIAQGSSTTAAATGIYNLTATGTGPYRIEFTTIPAGYSPSARSTDSVAGGTSANSGTEVQFVVDGNTSNVNLALNRPRDYCQNNPTICSQVYGIGAASNPEAIFTVPFTGGSTRTTGGTPVTDFIAPGNTSLATTAQVGTTFGLAYNRNTKVIYAAAFMKKHASFGPGGTGAIYQIDRATGTISQYVNLNTIFGVNTAGANPHNTADYNTDNGNATWDAVGKTAFGGMAISDDMTRLFVMNLANKRLYIIPTSGALNSTTIQSVAFPTTITTTCTTASDIRPFAVSFHEGEVYVGAVCSAESTNTTTNLRAYVYQFNPTTLTFGASPVFARRLNYVRNEVDPGAPAEWQPWTPTFTNLAGQSNFVYPQPMFSDIDFDNGNLIISLRDRMGDQTGYNNASDPSDATILKKGITAGDILRACGTVGSWTLESNGRCGGIGSAPQDTGEGPNEGEYYYQDNYHPNGTPHDEVGNGAASQIPGFPVMFASVMDPVYLPDNNIYDAGGFRWFVNGTGAQNRGYLAYNLSDFGKANGLGNTDFFCDTAPIELGNRVWRDTDGDGVQDPGENGIANVTVHLYNAGNTIIATAVTDANGEYYFTSGTAADGNTSDNIGIVNGQITANTNYQIRLDSAANYSGAGALTNLLMTTHDQTSQAGFADGSDSDSTLVTNPANSPAGIFPVISLTTGGNGDNNHTYDFGFTSSATYSLGNRVWYDTNNDGQINGGEVGLPAGISVSIFADNNSDGTPDTPSTPVGTTTTISGGYYRFDGLAAGNYVVRINPANFSANPGYQNTSITDNSDNDSTSVAGQNGENGINPTGAANSVLTNGILSGTITLGAPGEPVNEADVQAAGQGAVDAAANMTVDFGFYRACVSGTIWTDNGAGVNNNNGILNAGESGVPNVRVQLYNAAGTEISVGPDGILGSSDDAVNGVQTNTSGNYSFCGLPPGQYRVVVLPNGGTSSTPTSTNPDDNIDNNDDGTPGSGTFTGRVVSGLVTVTPGNTGALGNTAVTNSNGSTSNPTIDFGFVLPPTVVNLVKFEAFADMNGGVTLKWMTGGEASNLGFNLYRETGGKRVLVNNAPIAGSALKSSVSPLATGDSYSWYDEKGDASATYYLEDIDLNGTTNLHGAFVPTLQFSGVREKSNSKSLDELNAENVSTQVDSTENNSASAKTPKTNAAMQAMIASQNGVKISVNHDGWYRVAAEQLQASNFDLNANSDNWKLFANGIEVPMKVNFDNSIEFYGHGIDTPYTDTQSYYLVNGDSAGQRILNLKGGRGGETATVSSFSNTVKLKERTIYAPAILNGDAENWFGAVIMPNAPTSQDLTIYNPDANGQAHLSVKLQGLTTVNHLVNVKFNEIDLGTVSYSLYDNRQFEFDLPMSAVREGANQIVLRSVGGSSDINLVDSINLTYARQYKAQNERLRFSVPAGQTVRVSHFQVSDFVDIYEIRDGKVFNQFETQVEKNNGIRSVALMPVNYNRDLLLVGQFQAEPVLSVTPNEPSDWKNKNNKADFVIISPKFMSSSAERLAALRNGQGLLTKVVAVEDLYDEFTFGEHSPEAVKKFLLAARNWEIKPQFALLFGDSSFDMRNYQAIVNRDLIPTKLVDTFTMETASDAWLADFNNDGVEDIGLGRIPVINQTEADKIVDKLIRYEQPGSTVKSNLFVADSGFEYQNNVLRGLLPGNVGSSMINRSVLTDADMRGQILQKLNDGATVVTYSGHGTPTLWTSGNVLRADDAPALANQKLPFYLLMTCLNGYTHGESGDSLAEAMLKSNNGAIAVWASSAVTFLDGQTPVSETVTNMVFAPNPQRLGSILRAGKLSTSDLDVRRTWQLSGDPTVIIR